MGYGDTSFAHNNHERMAFPLCYCSFSSFSLYLPLPRLPSPPLSAPFLSLPGTFQVNPKGLSLEASLGLRGRGAARVLAQAGAAMTSTKKMSSADVPPVTIRQFRTSLTARRFPALRNLPDEDVAQLVANSPHARIPPGKRARSRHRTT